jgi:glutathione-regulated potassium-efflux system ancillary protein KefG
MPVDVVGGGPMSENPAKPNVLVVLAHPTLERSRANRAMAAAADSLASVVMHDLYEVYPDFLIDIGDEQARLAGHDLLVLQFPLYWYSTPALLKAWIDEVWLHGFAYGKGGTALEGKTLLVACAAGSPLKDYAPGGAHHFSVEEFLRPLQQTAALCKMRWADPFILHESRRRSAASLADAVERDRDRIAALALAPA